MFTTVVSLATILAPVVADLTVRNHLRASFQTGKLLTLTGIGSAAPELELGLIVDTGAEFSGQVTAGAVEVSGDATVLGLLAGVEYGPMAATSLEVAGIITAVAAVTALFAYQYYVAPVGDDVYGNGTITDPFQTIGKAVATAEAADAAGHVAAVILCAGTYTEDVLLQTGITLSSSSGAVIAGNVRISIAAGTRTDTVTLQGVTVHGSVVHGGVLEPTSAAHDLVMRECTISQVGDVHALEATADAHVYATDCIFRTAVTGTAALGPQVLLDDETVYTFTGCAFDFAADALEVGFTQVFLAGAGSVTACVFTLYVNTVDASTIAASLLRLDTTGLNTVSACTFSSAYDIVLNGPAGDMVGVRVFDDTTLYLLGNTFNVSSAGDNITGSAVANAGTVTTDAANVALFRTLGGISGGGDVVTLTPF